MRGKWKVAAACGISVVLVAAMAPAAAAAGGKGSTLEVLLDQGLSSPKGLAVTQDRDLAIGQGAFGAPGPALVYDLRGKGAGSIYPVTDPKMPLNLIDVAVSPKDGTGWGIQAGENGGTLIHQLADGTIVDVLDIPAYQATDPDPVDMDQPPFPEESNAYGLTVDRKGNALVADAANNDLLRVTPDGKAVTVARFDVEMVATDMLPPDLPFPLPDPLPAAIPAEAVPTTVTIGQDGYIYVGELKGVPFRPGSSNIWRIKADAKEATCSVTAPVNCTLYASGFTAIQDIAFGSGSKLYVYELAKEGVFAFEGGLETGNVPPAVLLAVDKGKNGKRTELVKGQLSQPGGVVVVNNVVYVTDSIFTGGRLSKIN